MRTDVKIGILVGVLIVVGAVIYVATREKSGATGPDSVITKPVQPVTVTPKPVVADPKPAVPAVPVTPAVTPQPLPVVTTPVAIPDPEPVKIIAIEPVQPAEPPLPVKPAVTEPGENTEPWYYVVQRGDSLSQIAERYYGAGNGRYWKVIFDANRKLIGDANRLQAGWILQIPRPEDVADKIE